MYETISPYSNEDWSNLQVKNPHFNVVNTYDFWIRHSEPRQLVKHLELQVRSAMAEDFTGLGEYELNYQKQSDGTYIFTNASFPDQSLIEIADRQIALKKIRNEDYTREEGERDLALQLTKAAQTLPSESLIMWTSPPGNKKEYPHQVSITYIGKFEGNPDSQEERKLKVSLFVHTLSLEGHAELLRQPQENNQPLMDAEWFVGQLNYLGQQDFEKTKISLHGKIQQIEAKGLVNPHASMLQFLDEQVFDQASDQIKAFTEFLHQNFNQVKRTIGINLTQSEVDYLERAYGLGYRSVKQYFNTNKTITIDQLWQDFKLIETSFRKTHTKDKHIHSPITLADLDPATVFYLHHVNAMLSSRYGSLNEVSTGGAGCPGGQLSALDFGYQTSSYAVNGIGTPLTGEITYQFTRELHPHHHGESCPEKQCRRCGNKDISETDTECRKCHWKPGEPVKESTKDAKSISQNQVQTQIRKEKLTPAHINRKHREKSKSQESLWSILFGLSQI